MRHENSSTRNSSDLIEACGRRRAKLAIELMAELNKKRSVRKFTHQRETHVHRILDRRQLYMGTAAIWKILD